MRIDSLGRPVGGPLAARPGHVRGAFSLGATPDQAPAKQAAPLRAAPSLDALMALQAYEEEGPRERRRREMARGRGLLDILDGMKIALVEGRDDPAAIRALLAQIGETRSKTGESGLDEVLSAIELRAHVELAKRGA
ncbi:flagellar assembly protein FliX [Methylopila sp. M107]|uniref:flagellar assembly protein FliX n=1 Tax=Methylopila sp. M107 TaxID=1101190 RepID=UPI000362C155|nr:flagellar assembly protein FliX [Methylopila sp. M107]